MLKAVSAAPKLPHSRMLLAAIAAMIALMMAVSACASGQTGPSTGLPTESLIRFTPTATSPPRTMTPTASPPPSAAEVLATRQADEGAAPVEAAVRVLLASQPDVQPAAVEAVLVEPVTWPGTRLDCDAEPDPRSLPRFAGFRVLLLAGATLYTYHTDAGDSALLCAETAVESLEPAQRVLVDAVAADLVALARRRLGADLDLPQTLIELVALEPATWDDNSLGCPVEGVSYAPGPIVGYRIVLAVGEDAYTFHTDFSQVMRCDR